MKMPEKPTPWFQELNREERRRAARVLRKRPDRPGWEHEEVAAPDNDTMTCGNCRHPVRICQCKDEQGQPLNWGLGSAQIVLDGKRLQPCG